MMKMIKDKAIGQWNENEVYKLSYSINWSNNVREQ